MSSAPTSDYREFRPAPPLARFVVCTWSQQVSAGDAPYQQRVMPDGCVDIVWSEEAPPVIVGPATRTFVAPLSPRSTLVGIRFRPGLAPVLLGDSAGAMRDREVALDDVWGPSAGRLAEQVAEQSTPLARIRQIESTFLGRLEHAEPADEVVVAAVNWMARRTTGQVAELCRSIGISPRQLHRRFHDAVGYSPKTLQRILRFQRLLALSRQACPPRLNLAALAIASGYADQAHMNREVRELSELTPTSLLKNRDTTLAMADFFKTEPSPPPMISLN